MRLRGLYLAISFCISAAISFALAVANFVLSAVEAVPKFELPTLASVMQPISLSMSRIFSPDQFERTYSHRACARGC